MHLHWVVSKDGVEAMMKKERINECKDKEVEDKENCVNENEKKKRVLFLGIII